MKNYAEAKRNENKNKNIRQFGILTCSVLPVIIIISLFACAGGESKSESKSINLPEKIAVSFEGEPKAVLIKTDGKKLKQVIDWSAGEGALHQIMFSHDGKLVFVTNSSKNLVHVLDGETFSHIKDVRVGIHPTHMSLSDDGKVLAVVSEESGEAHFISLDKLEVVGVVSGFRTPHFPRYADGKWFIANAGANIITVVDAENYKVIKELSVDGEPLLCQGEECGFFDIGLKQIAKLGAGVHSKTGKFIIFNTETLNVVRKGSIQEILEAHMRVMHDGQGGSDNTISDNLMAKVPVLSIYDQMLYIPFMKGVFIYNTTSGEPQNLVLFNEIYESHTASEIPGGVVIPMAGREKVALVSQRGEIKKIIDVGGDPSMVSLWNDTVFLTVATQNATRAKVVAITPDGEMFEIAEFPGRAVHGIHIPGAYPHCH